MLTELLVSGLATLISVLFAGRLVAPLLVRVGLVAQDINKKKHPILPASGGLILLIGIFVGVLVFVASLNFFTNASVNKEFLLLGLLSIIAVSFVGFIDDLMGGKIRTSKADASRMTRNYSLFNGGIRQWQKPLLTLIAALPLMVANFGTYIPLPFIGNVFVNPIFYILIFVPLVVVFLSNSFNMLEGLNGLSLQMALVVFVTLAIFTYHIQAYTAFSLAVMFAAGIIGYSYYGFYPAKLLPGDSLTYMLGGGVAAVLILGNTNIIFIPAGGIYGIQAILQLRSVWTVGLILAIPWIAEFILKARVKFHAHSWGILKKDGRLSSPHGNKVYSLTHLFLRTGKFKEWQIVQFFTVIEIILAFFALLVAW